MKKIFIIIGLISMVLVSGCGEKDVIQVHGKERETILNDSMQSVEANNHLLMKNNYLKKLGDIESNEYEKLDALLNDIYQYLKNNMSKEEFENLKKDEIKWIKIKDASKNIDKKCEYTKERCNFLISLFDEMKFKPQVIETINDNSIDYNKELDNFKNVFCERLNSPNDKNMSMDDIKIGKEISIDELKVEYSEAYKVFDEMVLSKDFIEESFVDKCLVADVDNDGIEDIQISYTHSGLGISDRCMYNAILLGKGNREFLYKATEDIGTWGSIIYCMRYNGINYQIIYDGHDYSGISLYSKTEKIGYKNITQKLINGGVFIEYDKGDIFDKIINRNFDNMNKENFEEDRMWLYEVGNAETLKLDGFWGAWYMTKKITCDVNNDGIEDEYTKYIPARGDTLAQMTPNQIEDILEKYEIDERDSFWVEKDELDENVICIFNIYRDNFVLNGYKIKNETCEQVFSINKNVIRKYE